MAKRSQFARTHVQSYVQAFKSHGSVLTPRLKRMLSDRHSRIVLTQAVKDGFQVLSRAETTAKNSVVCADRMWSTLVQKDDSKVDRRRSQLRKQL